jgi:hypothetical protein
MLTTLIRSMRNDLPDGHGSNSRMRSTTSSPLQARTPPFGPTPPSPGSYPSCRKTSPGGFDLFLFPSRSSTRTCFRHPPPIIPSRRTNVRSQKLTR